MEKEGFTPKRIFREASRSFYNSELDIDLKNPEQSPNNHSGWFVEQDFIPRAESTASIVIQGVKPGMSAEHAIVATDKNISTGNFSGIMKKPVISNNYSRWKHRSSSYSKLLHPAMPHWIRRKQRISIKTSRINHFCCLWATQGLLKKCYLVLP